MRYVLTPGDRGRLECRYLFPGDATPRQVSLESRKRFEVFLKQPFLLPEDRRLLMRLYMTASRGTEVLQLGGRDGYEILQELLASGRSVTMASESRQAVPLRWDDTSGSRVEVAADWKLIDGEHQQPVVRAAAGCDVVSTLPLVVFDPAEDRFLPASDPGIHPAALAWIRQGPLDRTGAEEWYRDFCARFPAAGFPSPPWVQVHQGEPVTPLPVLDLGPTGTTGQVPAARLHFDYHGKWIMAGDGTDTLRIVEGEGILELPRDRDAERSAAEVLRDRGLTRTQGGDWGPDPGRNGWHRFLIAHQEALQALGWRILFDEDRALRAIADEEIELTLHPGEVPDQFELEISVRRGTGVPPLNLLPWLHDLLRQWPGKPEAAIRNLLETGTFLLPVSRGETGLFSGERFSELIAPVFELHDPDPFQGSERIRVSALRAAEIVDALGLDESQLPEIPAPVRHLVEALRFGIQARPVAEIAGLKATLRDYQRHGVGWLQALSQSNLNGILADDMGLGKTLQTIAHLQLEKEAGRLEEAALLVAPTSLLANWRDEVARFAPGLTVITLHGEGRRTQFRAIPAADVVLTTYSLIQRDEIWHRDQHYSWIILDEAQFIKNPGSRIARSLGRIRADRRLCLTGTPVENHLGELWSLFDFLMPGFLGDRETFNRRFRLPIEREGSDTIREVLVRRVRPFLLRRKKNEVARELPPKTILQRPVEMTRRQRDVYESVREAMQLKVRNEIAEKGLARSKIVILEALTKLRQVCCDPRLAKRGDEALRPAHSAKLAELMTMLPDLVREDHRILVFSQFTSMLALIEDELRAAHLRFVTLTGSTEDRERPVTMFQSGKVPVFLISLRAGGTGLNLTAADTVIHYDPWWNPQIENQATDRAYRIGQERPVFVHKLVTVESVEEKIIAMQEKKALLAEGILGGPSSGTDIDFAAEDVDELFS